MTIPDIEAAQKAINLLYTDLMSKGLLTPEVKVVFHTHMNNYTELKKQTTI